MQPGLNYTGISVVFLCHDHQGKFLLQLRSQNCRDEQGKWDCGGGAVEFGAPVLDTLKTEIKQEYQTEILEYHYLGYRDVHRHQADLISHWVTLDFLVLIDHASVKIGEPTKIDQIDWFDLDNLPSNLHSQFPEFLEKYTRSISSLVAQISSH